MTIGTFAHWAFGRLIFSDIELPLLSAADRGVGVAPEAHVVVQEELLSPQGPPIGGEDTTNMTMYREGEDILLALNTTGWVARLAESRPLITLSPDARAQSPESTQTALRTRILGDRVVTTVLPYLPVLWGRLAMHGSLLSSPKASVFLLGESGFGKSTISQLLERDHGWRVLDDDTSMLSPSHPYELTPMGAQSRLRSDAAAELDLPTVPLPGYGGHKNAVVRAQSRVSHRMDVPVTCIVQLAPYGSEYGGAEGELALHPVAPERALGGLFASLFALSPDRPEAVQQQFATAAAWSSIRHLRLCYDKTTSSAHATALFLSVKLRSIIAEP